MEMTAKGYLDQLIRVRDGLPSEVDVVIMKNENKIASMNVAQMNDGLGTDDNSLIFPKGFTGVYQESTANTWSKLFPPILPKEAGQLYNFGWTGDFLSNFRIKLLPYNQIEIQNTGTGSGAKSLFFSGKTTLGLNEENQRKLNYEIILPEILEYVNKYL